MKAFTFAPMQESLYLAEKYGYDEWVVNRFLHFIPNAKDMMKTMQKPAKKYIRTNTLKTTSPQLVARLESKNFELKKTVLADVFEINGNNASISIGATTEYLLGHYYIQDISSCIAVEALDIKRNQVVLDMASAPGGKTTLIAQKMDNTGSIVAIESNPLRMKSLAFNLSRCGVINTALYRLDATACASLNLCFDRILLDAPCSGEGVIWKDTTRKTSRTPDDISQCSFAQKKLLEAGLQALNPGGTIVYSTCSFAPEENEYVVNSILDKFDVKVQPLQFGTEGLTTFGSKAFSKELKSTVRLYPHIHNSMGFYVAKLRKNT
ncbi:MAG TPA: NOL1/NOP2/sun family putative RNA methylase [Nitrososphaeraceae archaeon]|nr:NOL1/NOP2/sun family putative RNA methylase [Nitrososphaeraceae archaeon]